MIEIAIKISGDDQTLTQKYLVHEEGLTLSHDDPGLVHMVAETKEKFKGLIEDIVIKIKYTW